MMNGPYEPASDVWITLETAFALSDVDSSLAVGIDREIDSSSDYGGSKYNYGPTGLEEGSLSGEPGYTEAGGNSSSQLSHAGTP